MATPKTKYPALPLPAIWAKQTQAQWFSKTPAQQKQIIDGYIKDKHLQKLGNTSEYLTLPNVFGTKYGPSTLTVSQYLTAEAQYKLDKAYDAKVSGPGATNPYNGAYKFNAPMISNAYFNPLAGLKHDGLYGFIDNREYTNVAKAWKDGKGAKGAFQMDRSLNTAANLATAQKALASQNSPTQVDPTMYGFRFMYNPTTIDMAWGAIMAANPQYEGLNLDVVNPITSNLMNSTISFDILINRIEDMSYLNPDGSYTGVITDPTSANNYLNELASGSSLAGSRPLVQTSPYGTEIDKADRKAIYEKGTMYDIEYLFRSLHGFDGQSIVQTTLMGTTSDPGWLPVIPVELHLGQSMRYRVRVSSMSVHHSIFNVRMVPILSTITVTCNRYYDYSSMLTTTPKKKK